MRYDYPYLNDKKFLKQVDLMKIRVQSVKITVLNWNEEPIQSIEGIASSGSINIDGKSSVRRTANFNLVADGIINNIENIDNLISLNKKVFVEIGLKNFVDNKKYNKYETLWFPQGVFIICGVSINHDSNSNINISLQLKDKMCLLNGDVSGIIPAAVTLNEMDTYNGISAIDEDAYNLIGTIDDVEKLLVTMPSNLLYYDGEQKYALIVDGLSSDAASNAIIQPTIYQIIQEVVNHFGGEQLGKIIISDVPNRIKQAMKWIGDTPLYLCKLTDDNNVTSISYTINFEEVEKLKEQYQSAFEYKKITAGGNVGYIYTDFTFPGELIANAGDSVCSILDKIKDTLGNYEYFYDLNGNFVFQEIKNYLNTTQAKTVINQIGTDNYIVEMGEGKSVYDFEDNMIVSSISSAPQYNMIKNDFLVWGKRKNANGQEVPIRYHLAIDTKPEVGNEYLCIKYIDPDDNLEKYAVPIVYDSNLDLPIEGLLGVFYRCNYFKQTPESEPVPLSENLFFVYDADKRGYKQTFLQVSKIVTQDWRSELYLQGQQSTPLATDSNYYFSELVNEWPKQYDLDGSHHLDADGNPHPGYFDEILEDSTHLDFYLDLIDDGSAISNFSVSNIGRRQKVITDTSVNCIFEPYIEDIVLIEYGKTSTHSKIQECMENQQEYVQVSPNIYNALAIGGNFYSAYDAVRDLLYQYTSYNESVQMQVIPILYLEPNSRITIRDTESDIYGDFIVNSLSVPLDAGGTMSLSCTKALDKI